MKKYLITGFYGFVCRHFLAHLNSLNEAVEVMGIDRNLPRFPLDQFPNLRFSFLQADLLQGHSWQPALEAFRPDYILHLASFSSVAFSWVEPISSFSNNTNVFLNLLETSRKANPACRILSVGSSEEYGACTPDQMPLTEESRLNPVSPYAVARVSQEMLSRVYVDGFGCDIVMTRSFNHIGPGQRNAFVVASFAKKLLDIQAGRAAPVITTGDVSIVRDFVDVRDVVWAYDGLLRHGRSGEIYNICSGIGVPLLSLIDTMAGILDIQVTQQTDPQFVRPNDNKIIVGSADKIHKELGWSPRIALEQSLKDILDDVRRSLVS